MARWISSLTHNSTPNLPPPPRHPHSRNSTSLTPIPTVHRNRLDRISLMISTLRAEATLLNPSPSIRTNTHPRHASTSLSPIKVSGTLTRTKTRLRGEEIADDGRLTHIPTPGHPLLLISKLLVYPVGFECHKCASCVFHSLFEAGSGSNVIVGVAKGLFLLG